MRRVLGLSGGRLKTLAEPHRRALLLGPVATLLAWPRLGQTQTQTQTLTQRQTQTQPQTQPPSAGLRGAAAKSSHFPFGEVSPPRHTRPWPISTHLGKRTNLAHVLRGKTTALQFMFTGCTASCPIQGALFAQAQTLTLSQTQAASGQGLAAAQTEVQNLQWLSLSIDALADSPARLQAWLQKFSARAGWLAAVPAVADVDAIQAAWGEGGQRVLSQRDPHSGQVFVFNRAAQLVYRTAAIPPAAEIVKAMHEVARRWP